MNELITRSGVRVRLDKELKRGGEGIIFAVASDSSSVAKIYRQSPSESKGEFEDRLKRCHLKVSAMLDAPPRDPNHGHISIAWPTDTLSDSHFVGFLMPYVGQGADVIYNYQQPKQRREKHPAFSRKHAYQTASNLASAVSLIHHAGHVVGDMNPANILCRDNGLITLIDTDSFQIRARNGVYHRCGVGIDDWVAPEIQGKHRGTFDWLETHDRFSLAVHIWELLFGFHPFNGILKDGSQANRVNISLIERGIFPYHKNCVADPPPAGEHRFHRLSPRVQSAFVQTFAEGAAKASRRLSPGEWVALLDEERDMLLSCATCGEWYERHLGGCVECAGSKISPGVQVSLAPRSQSHRAAPRATYLNSRRNNSTTQASAGAKWKKLGYALCAIALVCGARPAFDAFVIYKEVRKLPPKRTSVSFDAKSSSTAELEKILGNPFRDRPSTPSLAPDPRVGARQSVVDWKFEGMSTTKHLPVGARLVRLGHKERFLKEYGKDVAEILWPSKSYPAAIEDLGSAGLATRAGLEEGDQVEYWDGELVRGMSNDELQRISNMVVTKPIVVGFYRWKKDAYKVIEVKREYYIEELDTWGIGVTLEFYRRGMFPFVYSVVPGGPAARAGLTVGAVIRQFDDTDCNFTAVKTMQMESPLTCENEFDRQQEVFLQKMFRKCRGSRATTVRLLICPLQVVTIRP